MKTVEQLAREAGFHDFYCGGQDYHTQIIQRFHDLAIAQYRESLLAGVGEPVAYIYGTALLYADDAPIGEPDLSPLLTADQMAAAVAIERFRCLNCYSPDDTVSDYQDKIRGQR